MNHADAVHILLLVLVAERALHWGMRLGTQLLNLERGYEMLLIPQGGKAEHPVPPKGCVWTGDWQPNGVTRSSSGALVYVQYRPWVRVFPRRR